MKYIITESRLENLINEYLTKIVGLPIQKHHHPSSVVSYIWFTNNKDEVIFEMDDSSEGLELGVREDLWNSVQSLFSLSVNETEKVFMEWMEQEFNNDFLTGAYTFEVPE